MLRTKEKSAEWQPLSAPEEISKPGTEWWLAVLERALISRAIDDLEVSKEYRPNPRQAPRGTA